MKRLLAVTILVLAGAMNGCVGTLANIWPAENSESDAPHRMMVYGGVGIDIAWVFGFPFVEWKNMGPLSVVGSVVGLVDLPFSVIGDTITLPWTITYQVKKLASCFDKAPPDPSPSTPPQP
jgi:uncharacterized protein YceK